MIAKPGNPHGSTPPTPASHKVTFKLDDETREELRAIEQTLGPNIRGRVSRAVREAIHEKFLRLRK